MVFLWVENQTSQNYFNNFDDILTFCHLCRWKSLVPLGIPGFDAIINLGFTIQNGGFNRLMRLLIRKFKMQISYFKIKILLPKQTCNKIVFSCQTTMMLNLFKENVRIAGRFHKNPNITYFTHRIDYRNRDYCLGGYSDRGFCRKYHILWFCVNGIEHF
jgi:hypothetical protein